MFTGDQFNDIEAEYWISDKPDFSQGKYIIHFWTASCLQCHTEIEVLAEIARRRDIRLVTLHQPKYDFEDANHLRNLLKSKKTGAFAAHKPKKQDWFTEQSPKKLVIENGEVKYHSSREHDLSEIMRHLGLNTGFDPEHNTQERHLGLENSALKPEHRFHGEKNVEDKQVHKEEISLSGKWKQTEKYIESVKNAEITFLTSKNDIYLVSDPKGSIKDIEIFVDHQKKETKRIKSKGIDHLFSLEEGQKQVTLKVENGLKLFKLDLV